MAGKHFSECYSAVCAEQDIKTNARVVNVLENTVETEDVILKLPGNHRLRGDQRLDDRDTVALSQCLRGYTCVTGLDVSYNNITDEGVGQLADLLQDNSSPLHLLDLSFNNINADGAEILAKSLQCNSNLLSLRLSGNKIKNTGAMHLASMMQVNDSLEELELASCDLATQSMIALSIVLKSNNTLRSIDLSRPLLFSHQEEWVVHFSEMLEVNGCLMELHLGMTGLTDTGMERLTDGLRLNRSLRYLDLRCNRVTRDGVRHLAEVLMQNPTLEIIDLSSNRIENEGALYLSEAVAWPGCVLRELSVCSNNIRTDGLLSLAQAMTASTTLNHIYIWGNHLEEPVCQAFSELITRGRLPPEQTDVTPYQVDGQVFLAEVFHSLRRHYYRTNGSSAATSPNSSTATDTITEHAASPDSAHSPAALLGSH